MMPSRGLRLPKGPSHKLVYLQSRNLSSRPTQHTFSSPATRIRQTLPSRAQLWQANTSRLYAGPGVITGVRHASWWNPWGSKELEPLVERPAPTSPPPPSPDQATSVNATAATPSEPATAGLSSASAPPSSSQSFPSLDTIKLDDIDLNTPVSELSKVSEHIGYLKELGLDYGWGPTSMMQWLLEHMHIWTGTPWWASIALTAVVMRTFMIPMYIKAADSTARSAALVTVTQPITDRMKAAQAAGDSAAVREAWMQLSQTRKNAGISFRDQFMPAVVQGILGYCMFKLLRAAASLPVPGFLDGGFLWIHDLTVQDPFLILPVVMGAGIHLLTRFGGETGAVSSDQMSDGIRNLMLYILPGSIVLITGWQPAVICVWFASTGTLGITQAILLRNPTFRRKLGIAPIVKPKPGQKVDNPFTAISDMMNKKDSPPKRSYRSSAQSMNSNVASVKPQWQAPSVRAASGKVIDVKVVQKDVPSEEKQASPPAPSMNPFTRGKAWFGDRAKEVSKKQKAAAEKQKAANMKKAADAYEKRARERGR